MVRDTLVTRSTTWFALWFSITTVMYAVTPAVSLAQQVRPADFESPIIEHSPQAGGVIGGVEVFGATVVDNDEIGAVSIFYRFSGENEFAQIPMREVAESSYYSAKVDTANVPSDSEAIEYYIQAEDVSGNIVLKGFAFQPLVRAFEVAGSSMGTTADTTSPLSEVSEPKINWAYVALGVLVVGGIAAASNGGGSGSADDCTGGCNVNLVFDRP